MLDRSKQRKILSDVELEKRLGRERLDALSLANFGGVMITEGVLSERHTVDIMFRQEPDLDLPFSGWVFCSSDESAEDSADDRGLDLHDCLAILRVAPEVAPYLDSPLGTQLVRTGEETFEEEIDEENES